MNNKLFGTDGVRGVLNESLTPEFVTRLALAIGFYFQPGSRILVGMDARAGGDAIKRIVIGALMLSGVKVYDGGYTPTPALQYVVKTQGFDGGVMITASHNPPEYNGIKVIGPHGIEVDREEERKIEEYFLEEKARRIPWNTVPERAERFELVNDIYVKGVLEHVDKELVKHRGFKVLVDAANSVGALTTPMILRELGAKPIVVNGTLDPLFPGRNPEPAVETLRETAAMVASSNADVGIAHDADADRAIIIDEKGTVRWGDRTATILAKYLKTERGENGKVYTAVSSSILVEEVLREVGLEVVWLKVGSVDIAHTLRRNGDALCGFEENGGFMYPPHQFVRDGGLTTALILEALAKWKIKASELYNSLPKYYTLKLKYKMPREKAEIVVEKVKHAYGKYRVTIIDGVRVVGEDFWFLVRPSGTEPLLRVMIEAKSEEKVSSLKEALESLIQEVIGK